MVGNSQRHPDRNRQVPEARARVISAPNIIFYVESFEWNDWSPSRPRMRSSDDASAAYVAKFGRDQAESSQREIRVASLVTVLYH
jgi:hypothetical protein